MGHPTAQLVTQGLHAANQCLTMQQAVPDPPDQSDKREWDIPDIHGQCWIQIKFWFSICFDFCTKMHTVQSGLLYYYLKMLHISDLRIPSQHPDSPSPHRPEGSPAVAFIRFAQYDALQARPWAATGSVPLVDLFLTTCAVPAATAPTGGGG